MDQLIPIAVVVALVLAWKGISPRLLLLAGVYVWLVPLVPFCFVAYRECPQLLLVPAIILFVFFRRQS